MNGPTSVVQMWRRRRQRLTRQTFACCDCKRTYLVRRRVCPGCGSSAGFAQAPLAPRGEVVAISRAGASVEHLDQVTDHKPSVLLELEGGGRLACLLGWSDAELTERLRGRSLRLTVRRIPLGGLSSSEPIPYGIKAAADLRTRLEIKKAATESREESS